MEHAEHGTRTWNIDRYTLRAVAPGIEGGVWSVTIENHARRARITVGRFGREGEAVAVAETLARIPGLLEAAFAGVFEDRVQETARVFGFPRPR